MKSVALKNSIAVIIVLAFCSAASGAEKKRIAVLPFSTKNVPPVAGQVIRDIIEVELISSQIFKVFEREQMELVLKEQEIHFSACDETACAIKYGRALSIDYMVIGRVMKLNKYVVSLRLVDVRKNLILSAEKVKSDSIKDLEKIAENLANDFLEQLNTDNPVPKKPQLRPNRFGTKELSLYFQYSFIPLWGCPSFSLPESYGGPVKIITNKTKVQALGGGISTSAGILPWLSLRGDFSVVKVLPEVSFSFDKSFTDANISGNSISEMYPLILSGDFLAQFHWFWGSLRPHVALGIGYSYYHLSGSISEHIGILGVSSSATGNSDQYYLYAENRKHFFSLVGEAGFTFYFNNNFGITGSCNLRYTPQQTFFKKVTVEKVSANIAAADPIDDIYQDLDQSLAIPREDDQLAVNFRIGFIFRMR